MSGQCGTCGATYGCECELVLKLAAKVADLEQKLAAAEAQNKVLEDLAASANVLSCKLERAVEALRSMDCECVAADPEYPHDCRRCEALRDITAQQPETVDGTVDE